MKTWQNIRDDPSILSKYFVREKVVDEIRHYFKEQGFREVFTPILVPTPSAESNLEVFETELRTASGLSRRAYLIMSPEYAIKKLLAAGIGSCFEITHCFRNEEEVSRLHNPEFMMLEWYRVGSDYQAVMKDLENLFVHLVKESGFKEDLKKWRYQGQTYDLTLPWPRITVREAFEKFCGVDEATLLDQGRLENKSKALGFEVFPEITWEQLFYQFFFNLIEPKLAESHRPWIVYDYPVSQAGLARRKSKDPRFAERFEVFLAGVELGNCFSELTDWQEQKDRFEKDLTERKKSGKTEYGIDEDFICALKEGLPKVAGIAVGVDRLVMLVADTASVGETMFFPVNELFDI